MVWGAPLETPEREGDVFSVYCDLWWHLAVGLDFTFLFLISKMEEKAEDDFIHA